MESNTVFNKDTETHKQLRQHIDNHSLIQKLNYLFGC